MASRIERNLGDWESQAGLGSFPGLIVFQAQGTDTAVGTDLSELWDKDIEHTWLTTGTTIYATSESAGDVGKVMQVIGLDANWDLQVAHVTLNGTTPVILGTALNWTVINVAYQVSADPPCAGDVWFAVDGAAYTGGTPNSLADVQAFVDFESVFAPHVTEKLWGQVPRDYKIIIYDYAAELNEAGGQTRSCEVSLEVAEMALGATVDNPSWAPWRRLHDITLQTASQVHEHHSFKIPHVFGELARVRMTAVASASSHVGGHITAIMVPAS